MEQTLAAIGILIWALFVLIVLCIVRGGSASLPAIGPLLSAAARQKLKQALGVVAFFAAIYVCLALQPADDAPAAPRANLAKTV
ncbi:hypothetical protein [Cupriavidus basilensis]